MTEGTFAATWRRHSNSLSRLGYAVRAHQIPLLMTASLAVGAAVLIGRIESGWWPHDDGSLAHSAERVLRGELPHRDFAELYTGLLTFLNAGVFAVFGENILMLRIPLFVLFLAFVACFFLIALRLTSPTWAFFATLAAITWSVPVYPAPMPSWYLLYLTTFGMYAVIRYFETQRYRWLVVGGIAGGIGVAIKVVGVWFILGAMLALLVEPMIAGSQRVSRRHAGVAIAASAAALGLAVGVLSSQVTDGNVAALLIPVTSLASAVALVAYRTLRIAGKVSAWPTARSAAIFLGCTLLPPLLLTTPYIVTGSVGDLIDGVFVAPRTRFEFAASSMPNPATLLWAAPVLALLVIRTRLRPERRRVVDVVAGAVLIFLVLTGDDAWSYPALWGATRALAPAVVVLGAYAMTRSGDHTSPSRVLVALTSLVAGFSLLLQFPFAAPVYFCYVVPLLVLAAIAALRSTGLAQGALPVLLLAGLVVFGARQLDRQSVLSLGFGYEADPQVAVLDHDRASIRVKPSTADDLARLKWLVARHRMTDTIFAGPDAPEVYFLTRSRNPTPVILDFLDRSGSTRGAKLVDLLDSGDISVVVVNRKPEQSPPLSRTEMLRIRALYPESEVVGDFEVRWRDTPS